MPSCSSIFRPTTRSQRARSAPPGYRTSERPLRDAFHRPGQGIRKGPEASVVVPPLDRTYTKFHACFTRGYISSQAYADKFTNAEIRPAGPKTPDFNTKPYQPNMSGSAQAPAPSCSRFSTITEATKAARSTFGWPFLAVPAQQSFHQVRRGLGAEVFTGKGSHRRA